MKLLYFAFLALLLSAQAQVFSESRRAAIRQLLTTCQEESHATASDIQNLVMKKIPPSRTGLCLLECILDKAKIMAEGKFNKEGLVNAFKPLTKGNVEKLSNLKKLSEICSESIQENSDKCQNAKLIIECISENGNDYGVPLNFSNI